MSIQHRTVDIEAAAKLWRDDLSASQIAKRFGVSRNVIVGLAFRNRSLFPWRGDAGKKTSAPGPAKTARPRKLAPELKREPEIPATAYDADRLQSAKLLHHLSARECCWPLGNGGPYLFCAAETTGRYCRNHHARSLPKKNEGKA
ncbi:GcrA family cell cycle regulator [Sinorhizobium meliloti]|uniref:GcrA family cell cycle regulator n=1 Tax=Rhizobium meliloti TaxID=382 RepID=UPI000FD8676C|nr:GcrA family cell cycle regulator [Sinorhizobium meliloti]MDW9816706.1 GcrA cell cycle regulator [Sinorhizobium meliloti]RVN13047.1 GcrA cell cycle regulator [Sinorhizobium meliloti]RVN21769.1 GcrA cell cycle regulator [Sinorhizobium meliloti]RVN43555.1 GcrA cell cycle regulator [Sinorhizobium meliloti]RVO05212.1 GcrA cell cycle regulator [Sinorhizobium meliloti]